MLLTINIRGTRSMALTKAHIVESVAKKCGYTKQKSADITETILELIKKSLESGENVLITNFGKFYVKEKRARKGWNLSTGELAIIAPKRVVTFRCSGKLKKKINR